MSPDSPPEILIAVGLLIVPVFLATIAALAVTYLRSQAALRRLQRGAPLTGKDLQDVHLLTLGALRKAKRNADGALHAEIVAVEALRRRGAQAEHGGLTASILAARTSAVRRNQ